MFWQVVLKQELESGGLRATSLSLPTFQHGGQCSRHLGYLQAHFKRLSFAALQSHRLLPVLLTGCHLISEISDGRGALSSSAPPTLVKWAGLSCNHAPPRGHLLRSSFAIMSDPPAHKRLRPAGEDGEEEDPAVTRFREYLRIPTISATENTNSAYGEQSTVKSQDKRRLYNCDVFVQSQQ